MTLTKEEIKEKVSSFGWYSMDENCLYQNDNKYLRNEEIKQIIKENRIKVQLDLFT